MLTDHAQLEKVATERSELARATFIYDMGAWTADMLVFLDETSKDERTLSPTYGYSRRGQRARVRDVFVRGKRYTVEAAMATTGIIAYDIVEGSYNAQLFCDFLTNYLVRCRESRACRSPDSSLHSCPS